MINNEELYLPNRWQAYIGIMTEPTINKNQRWFHIHIPELLPTTTGDVTPESMETKVKIQNVWKGTPQANPKYTPNTLTPEPEETKIKITKTVYADYFGIDPTTDVPTMYKGMQVLVINFDNTDKWYWLPLERDRSYKTFEHFRLSALDDPAAIKTPKVPRDDIQKRNEAITDDNTYYLEIDTKYHKHIMLSTAASDEEKFRYFFKIDANEHTVELWDKKSSGDQKEFNRIKLASNPEENRLGSIMLQTADATTIHLNGPDMEISVPGNLLWDIKGDTVVFRHGHYLETTDKDYNRVVHGNQITENDGTLHTSCKGDCQSTYGNNLEVSVMNEYADVSNNRIIANKSMTITAENSFNLSTKNLTSMINTLSGYVGTITLLANEVTAEIDKLTSVIAVFSATVLMQTTVVARITEFIPVAPVLLIF